jgi:hypothetical protein
MRRKGKKKKTLMCWSAADEMTQIELSLQLLSAGHNIKIQGLDTK